MESQRTLLVAQPPRPKRHARHSLIFDSAQILSFAYKTRLEHIPTLKARGGKVHLLNSPPSVPLQRKDPRHESPTHPPPRPAGPSPGPQHRLRVHRRGRRWPPAPRTDLGRPSSVQIDERIARTRTDQIFTNHAEWEVEGIYEFTLPEGAIITDLVLWIGDKRIQGDGPRKGRGAPDVRRYCAPAASTQP